MIIHHLNDHPLDTINIVRSSAVEHGAIYITDLFSQKHLMWTFIHKETASVVFGSPTDQHVVEAVRNFHHQFYRGAMVVFDQCTLSDDIAKIKNLLYSLDRASFDVCLDSDIVTGNVASGKVFVDVLK